MAISGVSAAGIYAPSQPPVQTLGTHKHGAHHNWAISDIDAQGSSVATKPSASGKVGSKVDITA